MPSQNEIYEFLREHPGERFSCRELGAVLGQAPSNMSHKIKQLGKYCADVLVMDEKVCEDTKHVGFVIMYRGC